MNPPILTITLNPSVDKSSSVHGIVPDKKLRCVTPRYEPGGGGINVSRALKRLGVASSAFFVSGGRTGKLLEQLLKEENLDILPLPVSGETRESFIVVDASNNQQYRFGFPGEHMSPAEQSAVLETLGKIENFPEISVISGSLPAGVSPAFIRELIGICKAKGAKVIVDTSGQALHETVEEGVFLIKPNIGELASLSGVEELDEASMDKAAVKLVADGKSEVVVVSLGASGAVLYSKDEKVQLPAPVVKKRSTVGAGDSMVAGMVSVLVSGGSREQMLKMGIACGSATTMAQGTGLFRKADVDRLMAQIVR